MRRKLQRLSAKEAEKTRRVGFYPDGAGLYLQVGAGSSKSWIFRYKLAGKERQMGLGSLRVFSLAEARTRAADARKLLADKIDPIAARDALRAQDAVTAAKLHTFDQCAAAYIRTHRAGWRNTHRRTAAARAWNDKEIQRVCKVS